MALKSIASILQLVAPLSASALQSVAFATERKLSAEATSHALQGLPGVDLPTRALPDHWCVWRRRDDNSGWQWHWVGNFCDSRHSEALVAAGESWPWYELCYRTDFVPQWPPGTDRWRTILQEEDNRFDLLQADVVAPALRRPGGINDNRLPNWPGRLYPDQNFCPLDHVCVQFVDHDRDPHAQCTRPLQKRGHFGARDGARPSKSSSWRSIVGFKGPPIRTEVAFYFRPGEHPSQRGQVGAQLQTSVKGLEHLDSAPSFVDVDGIPRGLPITAITLAD